jgi:3-polyprenyl-4-hydroxybenzoate decarboxylase
MNNLLALHDIGMHIMPPKPDTFYFPAVSKNTMMEHKTVRWL